MSEENKKYILNLMDFEFSTELIESISKLNLELVPSSKSDFDPSEASYCLLNDLEKELPDKINKIYIGEAVDPSFLLSKGVTANIDPVILNTKIGENIFLRYLGKNSGLALERVNNDEDSKVGVLKITSFSDVGYYSDIISDYAAKNEFNYITIRSYFIAIMNYFEMLSQNNILSLPVEIDFGKAQDNFVIQMHSSSFDFNQGHILNSLEKIDDSDGFKSFLTLGLKYSDILDIYTLLKAERFVITGSWLKDENPSDTSFFVNNINSFVRNDEALEEDSTFTVESNLDKSDIQRHTISEFELNDDLKRVKSSNEDFFDQVIQKIKGMSEDEVSKIIVSGDAPEEDLTKTVIEGVTEDITEEVIKVSGETRNLGKDWGNKISSVIENVEKIKKNTNLSGDKEGIQKEINRIIIDNLGVENNDSEKITKKIIGDLSPSTSERVMTSSMPSHLLELKVESLNTIISKKDDHLERVKKVMSEMQSKMIDLSKRLKETQNENIKKDLLRKQDLAKSNAEASDDSPSLVTNNEMELARVKELENTSSEQGSKIEFLLKDKATLEKTIKRLEDEKAGYFTQEDIDKINESHQNKTNQFKQNILQKDREVSKLTTEKNELASKNHALGIRVTKLTASLSTARDQMQKTNAKMKALGGADKKDSQDGHAIAMKSKQLQKKVDMLTVESKKNQEDLVMKKKEVLDMKKDNTIMKREVETLKKKLSKLDKKAA